MTPDYNSDSRWPDPTSREDALEKILGGYVDRLNAGEILDREVILTEQPELGEELMERLDLFKSVGASVNESSPLGTLGDYTLRRQIGRGGMGVVYAAWQNSMDRQVALKVLPRAIAFDTRAVARFVQEAQLAGKLSHPNIVHVHGMGVEEQVPYFAMELVEGETLAQVLAKLRIAAPEEETPFGKKDDVRYFANLAEAFADVADGLQHAHSKGIIHRDIKPSNLILDREGRLRILDFGLARLEGQASLTISGDMVGTPQYMSPEQARRKKILVDHRTDVYSLGATLYEMLTGRPPFRGKDHNDTLSQIIERDPVEPRNVNQRVPKDLETIVLKCLRKDAGDRYGTAEALGQDLRRFVRGELVEARPEGSWERLARRLRRHRQRLLLYVLSALFLVTVTLLFVKEASERRVVRESEYRAALHDAAQEIHLSHFSNRVAQTRVDMYLPELERLSEHHGPKTRLAEQFSRLKAARQLAPDRPEAPFYQARILLALRHTAEARTELQALAAQYPEFTAGLALLAMLDEQPGSLDPGGTGGLRLSGDEAAARGLLFQARTAAARGDWSASANAWTQYIDTHSSHSSTYPGEEADILMERGRARLAAGDHLGAHADFVQASTLLPGAQGPALLAAYALLLEKSEGAESTADAWLQGAYTRTPQRDELALHAAWLYLDKDLSSRRAHLWIDRISEERLRSRARLAAHVVLHEMIEATTLGDQLLAAAPDDTFVAAVTAQACCWAPGHSVRALKLAQALSRRRDVTPFVRLQLAEVYWPFDVDTAIQHLEETCQLQPDLLEARISLVHALSWAGRIPESERLLRSFSNPDQEGHSYLLLLHGVQRRYLGDSEGARRLLERSVASSQGQANFARLWLAHIYWEEGELARAEQLLRDNVRGVDKGCRTREELAALLVDRKEHDEALVHYCLSFPNEPFLHWPWVDWHLRRFASILRPWPLPRDLSPLDGFVGAFADTQPDLLPAKLLECLALGNLLAPSRQDPVKARFYAEQAVAASDRQDASVLTTLALIQLSHGEREEAVLTLEYASGLPSEPEWLQAQLAEYRRSLYPRVVSFASCDAMLQAADGDVETARRLLEKWARGITEIDEMQVAFGHYLEARVRELAGELPLALDGYLQSAACLPSRAEPILGIARTLRRLGKPLAAERALQQAIANGCEPAWDLWVEWMRTGDRDLGLTAAALMERLPTSSSSKESSQLVHDFAWLLAHLASGTPLAIDCGAEHDSEFAGKLWSRDRFQRSHCSFTFQPVNRGDPQLLGPHASGRGFDEDLAFGGYRIPLPCGRYLVTLLGAEYWGARSYLDIWIEGELRMQAYQALREVGYGKADSHVFAVSVEDGVLDIQLRAAARFPGFPVHLEGIEIQPAE